MFKGMNRGTQKIEDFIIHDFFVTNNLSAECVIDIKPNHTKGTEDIKGSTN